MKVVNFLKELDHFNDENIVCLLKPINQISRINTTLLKCYNVLEFNGLLGIKIQTLENKELHIQKKLGKRLYKIVYPIYFILKRVIPKIRVLGEISSFLTGGKNRWVSKTEIIGRLNYCGFTIVHIQSFEKYLIIIARKNHLPFLSQTPSFHAIISLDRVGFEGRMIKIHKVRTMYPYSEFLQKKVFEENQLNAAGKFNNDYRITTIGRFFRKYWIDEFPQLLDWLRGNVKIVGIRAMSRHYFSLYPKEYKALYLKVKPGLISPLFDENNSGFEEIVKVERNYLEEYLKTPIKTDVRYFFKILKQIIIGTRGK